MSSCELKLDRWSFTVLDLNPFKQKNSKIDKSRTTCQRLPKQVLTSPVDPKICLPHLIGQKKEQKFCPNPFKQKFSKIWNSCSTHQKTTKQIGIIFAHAFLSISPKIHSSKNIITHPVSPETLHVVGFSQIKTENATYVCEHLFMYHLVLILLLDTQL